MWFKFFIRTYSFNFGNIKYFLKKIEFNTKISIQIYEVGTYIIRMDKIDLSTKKKTVEIGRSVRKIMNEK